MLVSVGAALFTLVSAYAWTDFTFSQASGVTFDPTRIAAQIVTGIGFIGAGAIIRQGLTVRGLTTAATLWMVAAIGMACGAGFYWAAVIATAIALVGLGPLRFVSKTMFDRPHRRELVVELAANAPAAPVLAALEQLGVGITSFSIAAHGDGRQMACVIELPHRGPRKSCSAWASSKRSRASGGTVSACAPVLAKRAQARRAGADPAGLADRAARGGRLPARNGRPFSRTRARRPSTAAGRPSGRVDARRGLGARAERPRRAAGSRDRALGGGATTSSVLWTHSTARPTGRRATSASSSRSPRKATRPEAPARSRGRSLSSRAATKASASTLSSSPLARSERSPSSATNGRRALAPCPRRTGAFAAIASGSRHGC